MADQAKCRKRLLTRNEDPMFRLVLVPFKLPGDVQ